MIDSILQQIADKQDLTQQQAAEVIDQIMQGKVENEKISSLLLGLREKGEAVEEIAGAAQALRKHMSPIRSTRTNLVDTCGTGGDGSNTFNVSTAAAIVAAATGVNVAKHGNRKVSSKSGSADVLTCLGVNVGASIETVQKCLDEVGICFCFAPLFHASMKNVAEVRKSLGVPSIFNMLGPLCNPAGAEYQLLGVGKPELREKIASALQLLGTKHSLVVHGCDGICEISNAAETSVTDVAGQSIEDQTWSPADFGVDETNRSEIEADNPEESAEKITQALSGKPGGPRNIVVINAAAAIWLAGVASDLRSAATVAGEAIDSGAAMAKLKELAKVSHS